MMFWYVLTGLLVAAILLIAPAFRRFHPPVHPRTHCRCGRKADIQEHTWPWRTWCAGCHIRRLRRKGNRV